MSEILKLPASRALAQINAKGYAEPFAHGGRGGIKVKVRFDYGIRNIG